jgi:hypothetical protein
MPSGFTPFKQQLTTDRITNQVQQNVAAAVTSLQSSAIAAGQLVTYTPTSQVAADGTFTLQHNLGRVPLGIIPLLSQGSYATITAISGASSTPTKSITLVTSAAIPAGQTLSFWVF